MKNFLGIFIFLFILSSCAHVATPVKDDVSAQIEKTDFGPVYSQKGFAYPLKVLNISSRGKFEWRKRKRHKGVDLIANKGTEIYAIDDGEVIRSGKARGYGNRIVIAHNENLVSLYGHNFKNLVTVGEKVKKGQVIALVGRTGRASGNHLHFEIRLDNEVVNPIIYLEEERVEYLPEKKPLKKKKPLRHKRNRYEGEEYDEMESAL